MVDALDLESSAFWRGGSTPPLRTSQEKEIFVEHSIEDVSPVKKKITIKISPEEINTALKATTALYGQNVQIPGYRKGKAPQNIIEKRFHDEIYKEARSELLNAHLNEALKDVGAELAGSPKIISPGASLQRDVPFEYAIEVEVIPQFELPNYQGLEAEEEKAVLSEELVDRMLKRMQEERGTLIDAPDADRAEDGQVAIIDFETFLNGVPVKDFKTTGFNLEIGRQSALPEFEQFVKTIPVGHTAEKEIQFPDDFIAPELAGKKPLMKVTVHSIKNHKLPEIDDDFARQAGKKDLAELRADLSQSYMDGMRNLHKAMTQQKLLDKLTKQTDFPLPETMVEAESTLLIGDMISRAEQAGKRVAQGPAEIAKLKEEVRPRAEVRAREKIILKTIAKQENLSVPPQEVEKEVLMGAYKMGIKPAEYLEKMQETGMLYKLQENMLCDKAMDLIYERAKIHLTDPKPESEIDSQSKDSSDTVEEHEGEQA